MSRPTRLAIIGSWIVVAFVLLRMAWGGSVGGIIYVVSVTHPAVLLAGAGTIVGAIAIVILLMTGATSSAVTASIVLGILAVPLALVLMTQDHGSAPLMAVAALGALTLSAHAKLRPPVPSQPPS
jgi:hypothetical protein